MAETQVLRPFKDGKEIWIGLDSPGFRRKVFRLVDKEMVGSEHIVAGLTIFEPGESSSRHNHPIWNGLCQLERNLQVHDYPRSSLPYRERAGR